jgi:protein TonB
MNMASRCYPGGPDLGVARSIDDRRQACPGRAMMPVGKPVSGERDARGMALAVAASLLLHALIAARLLSAPGIALQTPFDTDVQVDVLLDTPAPSAAGTASPDDKPQAEPAPPPAPVAEIPPPPPPAEPAAPATPAEAIPPIPPPEAVPTPLPPPPAEAAPPAVPAEASPPPPPPEAVPPVKPRPAAPPVAPRKPPVHRPIARHSPAPTPEPGSPAPQSDVAAMAAALTPARPLQGYAGNRDPIYPEAARRRGEQGRVILRVDVSSGGQPVSVIVQQSSGFPRLDDAAAAAVRQWRFEPAARGGKSMAGIAEVPILFRLEN